jgi:sugar phosphate isomerase/epimerase
MKKLGNLKTKQSSEIKESRIGIGFECLDRDLYKPEKCYDLFAKTGAKFARCQTGWAKVERIKGVYDWAWLDDVIDNLINCPREWAEVDVPIVVIHPIIGMDRHNPTDLGIERYGRLVREAEKLGIKVAFENVEGIEYLEKIIADLGSSPAIGYCWDTGHEMCYNNSMDVPALFGDKLICTHLNDNLGQIDPNEVTWLDDAHLFPFDGIADWQGIADRLNRISYAGELTFELTLDSKPGRNTHDIYNGLTMESGFELIYNKAVQFAQMLG